MDQSDQPKSMGVEDAVNLMLEPKEDSTDDTTTSEEQEPDTEVQNDEEEQSTSEVDEESTEEADSDSDAETEEEEDQPSFLFTVTSEEGEEIGITEEEARLGYLRQQDYTKKTTANAESNTQLDQERKEVLGQKGQLASALQQLSLATDQHLGQFANVDWEGLKVNDPIEFEEKLNEYKLAELQSQQLRQAAQAQQTQFDEEVDTEVKRLSAIEDDKLMEFIPEMVDPVKRTEVKSNLSLKARETYGFTEDEMTNVLDHRYFRVLNDALKFHELNSKIKTGEKKVQKTPGKTVKSGQPQTKQGKRSAASKKSLDRVKQTGSTEDAVRYLLGE